jgi:hypothetical protein
MGLIQEGLSHPRSGLRVKRRSIASPSWGATSDEGGQRQNRDHKTSSNVLSCNAFIAQPNCSPRTFSSFLHDWSQVAAAASQKRSQKLRVIGHNSSRGRFGINSNI